MIAKGHQYRNIWEFLFNLTRHKLNAVHHRRFGSRPIEMITKITRVIDDVDILTENVRKLRNPYTNSKSIKNYLVISCHVRANILDRMPRRIAFVIVTPIPGCAGIGPIVIGPLYRFWSWLQRSFFFYL